MKFLIFVSLLLAATDAELSEQEKVCVDFAFENKTLTSPDDIDLCKKFFKDRKAEYRAEFEARFFCLGLKKEACDSKNRTRDCSMKTFDEHRIGDLYMKGLIRYLHSAPNDTGKLTLQRSLSSSKFNVNMLIEFKCVDNAKIEETLQQQFERSKKMPAEEIACLRRYAFEKNIIDPGDYDFDVATLTSYDCESAFKVYDTGLSATEPSFIYFGISDQAISDCEKNKFESTRLIKKTMLRISAIATFDISPQQQSEVINLMIVTVRSASSDFLECVRNYCVDHCEEY